MTTIDAHQHFWRTGLQDQPWLTHDHAALERDFLPADLAPELAAAGVEGTVLMQSVDEHEENVRLAEYAKEPSVAGVVAWIPIRTPREALAELESTEIEKLCGVRCLISDDPLEWLTSPEPLSMFREIASRSLAWDVVPITAEQTRQVIALSRAVPELSIVVDHLGRPPLDSGAWEPWADNVAELASSPNVSMKLSVGIDALTKWGRWDSKALERYAEYVCGQFGAQRLMLASNWPVVLLRASYSEAWNDLRRLAESQFPAPEDRLDVLGRSAQRLYGLRGTFADHADSSTAAVS